MRVKVVLHYLGLIVIGIGLAMIFPLAFSLFYREPDIIPFLISIGITAGSGFLITLFTPRAEKRLSTREALALVAGAWAIASAFSALPYMLAGTFHSYLDAYFETMAGYTTTGSSVLTNIEAQPHGILLWRSFTQWLGGMGIITLFVAVFSFLGVGPVHMMEAEIPGEEERLTARIRDTARIIWRIYVVISAIEVTFLLIAGMPFYDSLVTTFSTVSTGGFLHKNISIAAYNSVLIDIIVIVFMVVAGANIGIFYTTVWKRKLARLLHDTQFLVYLGIIIASSILISLDLLYNLGYSLGDAFRFGIFNTVSISSTTGFATADFDLWPAFSRVALIILMIIGGSTSSTAGALKVIRIVILVKYVYREMIHIFSPRAVLPIKLGGKTVPEWIISRALGFVTIYGIIFVISFLIMSAVGLDVVSALSSVAATMGNVGPGLGSVGPSLNFASVPPVGKVVLIIDMLTGRLEIWAILVLFSPAFWRWR